MESSAPVDGNVALLLIELNGAVERSTGIELSELKESIKDWTIGSFAGIEFL